jgi:hypothetical protein
LVVAPSALQISKPNNQMTILETKTPVRLFNFAPHLQQKLTAAEKKIVTAHSVLNAELHRIILATEPDRHGGHGELHALRDKAEQAFLESPSRELAEAIQTAQLRLDTAAASFTVIDQACHQKFAETRRELASIVNAVAERALADLNAALATHRTALQAAGGLADDAELAQHDERAQATREALGATIAEVSADPLKWLASFE